VRAGAAATAHVSADFFRLFGATVAAGRTFSADEDLPNGGRVVVLSEGFWALVRELRLVSGGLPVAPPRTMDEVLVRSTARSDFNMILLTTFAGAALLLAAIGIYGLMAYIQQRTQEIGIRMALGAGAHTVRNMVVRQGMSVALAGVVIGVASAFGLTRVLASLLFGVTARDALVFVGVPLLLSAVALAGVWLPARRAASVDPVVALRTE
jgi:putative ABC transport system permease protein